MTNHEICHCTRARSSQSLQFRLNLSGLLRWTVLALVEISIFNWFGHLERGRRRNLAQGQLTSWLVLFVAVPGYFPLNFDISLPKNHQLNLYSCSPVQTFVGLRSLFPQAFRRRISNFWKKKKMLKFFFFLPVYQVECFVFVRSSDVEFEKVWGKRCTRCMWCFLFFFSFAISVPTVACWPTWNVLEICCRPVRMIQLGVVQLFGHFCVHDSFSTPC